MENILLALAVTGIGLVILLLILAFLALLVNAMTSFIKGKEVTAEGDEAQEAEIPAAPVQSDDTAQKAAALAVAFARLELSVSSASEKDNEDFSSWREFHRARRLNLTIRARRY